MLRKPITRVMRGERSHVSNVDSNVYVFLRFVILCIVFANAKLWAFCSLLITRNDTWTNAIYCLLASTTTYLWPSYYLNWDNCS